MIQLRNIVIADLVVPRKTVRLDVVSTLGVAASTLYVHLPRPRSTITAGGPAE